MSRLKETQDCIDDTYSNLIWNIDNPAQYLLPMLSEIALSLAMIADKLTDGKEDE